MTFPLPRQLYYVAEATVHLGEDPALGEAQSEVAVNAYCTASEDEHVGAVGSRRCRSGGGRLHGAFVAVYGHKKAEYLIKLWRPAP